ncbi:histone deacetylase 11 isoform X2 [Trachinotus anak]|uniref:histone deacetylase 11 isoform X2 n=1 Tax=Trachinotus anak TaxID=443729 RepID=UPI0039F20833
MSHKEDSEGKRSSHHTELYASIPRTCLPIVYHPDYNITFMGLEKLHPFDAGKWGKVIRFLKEEQFISDGDIVGALEATEEDLLVVHTKRYLNRLKWSVVVATITEIPPLLFLPNFLVQRKVLRPLRTQTGGTIMAGKLAVDRGWAINVGGGFHHCSSDRGGGFCAYADITLAIKFLFERVDGISRATIIDLDAHQMTRLFILHLVLSDSAAHLREMDTNETSWMTGECSSWTCIIATYILGMDLPKRLEQKGLELEEAAPLSTQCHLNYAVISLSTTIPYISSQQKTHQAMQHHNHGFYTNEPVNTSKLI